MLTVNKDSILDLPLGTVSRLLEGKILFSFLMDYTIEILGVTYMHTHIQA